MLREALGQGHDRDFLTVGSMGHTSSIALGFAAASSRPAAGHVWCIDGDGAVLMHMGSLAVLGIHAPAHFVHVIINNAAHESVGGIPTVAGKVSLRQIATGCGYRRVERVTSLEELWNILPLVLQGDGPVLLEIGCAMGSRENLGRPGIAPKDAKKHFMERYAMPTISEL